MFLTDGEEKIEVYEYKHDQDYLISMDKKRFFCIHKKTKKVVTYLEIDTTEPEFEVV